MILIDRFGNLRAQRKSGKGAIKRSEAAGSRRRHAALIRVLRHTRPERD